MLRGSILWRTESPGIRFFRRWTNHYLSTSYPMWQRCWTQRLLIALWWVIWDIMVIWQLIGPSLRYGDVGSSVIWAGNGWEYHFSWTYLELVLISSSVLPRYSVLTCSVFGIAYFAYGVAFHISENDDLLSKYGLMFTLNMSFSVATTILSTLLIAIRILMSIKKASISAGKWYNKPMEIIVESSALYAITFLVYIPFFVISSDWADLYYQYPEVLAQSMTVSFACIYISDKPLIATRSSPQL